MNPESALLTKSNLLTQHLRSGLCIVVQENTRHATWRSRPITFTRNVIGLDAHRRHFLKEILQSFDDQHYQNKHNSDGYKIRRPWLVPHPSEEKAAFPQCFFYLAFILLSEEVILVRVYTKGPWLSQQLGHKPSHSQSRQ